jgi:anti-anti-sigma factor
MAMKLEISSIENGKKVKISGDLELQNSDMVLRNVLDSIDKSTKTLLMDLKEITFLDSMGIRILVNIRKHLIDNEGSMILTNVPPHIMEIFKLASLDKYFTIQL